MHHDELLSTPIENTFIQWMNEAKRVRNINRCSDDFSYAISFEYLFRKNKGKRNFVLEYIPDIDQKFRIDDDINDRNYNICLRGIGFRQFVSPKLRDIVFEKIGTDEYFDYNEWNGYVWKNVPIEKILTDKKWFYQKIIDSLAKRI